MVTAHGIFTGIGTEGNSTVNAIAPSSEPILQIIFMASTIVASFWFVFYSRRFLETDLTCSNCIYGSVKYWIIFYLRKIINPHTYHGVVAWGSVFACGTHMFGIATWFI
jgi:hypothetical protein